MLLSPGGEVAHALNESAAGVWRLCDGQHTPLDMVVALRAHYDGRNVDILADVTAALFRLHQLGLVILGAPDRDDQPVDSSVEAPARPRVRFLFGIEDTPYFHWQLGILFESLVGQLGPGWDITLVICNDHQPISLPLARLLDVYGVRAFTGENRARSHEIDFSAHEGGYAALNRVEALKVMAGHVEPEDVVCLMDTDLFLYGDLQPALFPGGNAMARNGIIADPLFLSRGDTEHGIDLQKLLGALGCQRHLKRGGVTVFMTGATL
ncbi:MAG TPA: PqqD family protein, partial [Burkholderiaceae bacterium]|nr:PqqD family protein [Burkholderiaceae bacterium]